MRQRTQATWIMVIAGVLSVVLLPMGATVLANWGVWEQPNTKPG
jgi:hypothetical protein